MYTALRILLFAAVIRPAALLLLGVSLRGGGKLPNHGPAIIVANHNSHLDTLILMALMRLRVLASVRPVAAADYFADKRILGWFARRVLGAILFDRGRVNRRDVFADLTQALDDGAILILFPEGTRGEPEVESEFRRGVVHILRSRPHVPVHPVRLCGLGKVLPKGARIPIPFNCDAQVGEPISWAGSMTTTMAAIEARMRALQGDRGGPAWL